MGEGDPLDVLIVTGPIGVGKTVTMWEVGEQLEVLRRPHAMIDFDDLVWSYPRPRDDPFNLRVGFRNLRSVWANFSELGIRTLLLAYVVESQADLSYVRAAVGDGRYCVCRLEATEATLRDRLSRREVGSDRERQLARALELSRSFAVGGIGDFVVHVDDKTVPAVALEVLTNWLSTTDRHPSGGSRSF